MTLEEYTKLHITDRELLPFKTVTHIYKKRSRILDIGMQEQFIYFIISGVVEIGLYVKNNKEYKILDFYFQGQFPSAFMSYAKKEPSDVYISCVTDCIIEKIALKDLEQAKHLDWHYSYPCRYFKIFFTESAKGEKIFDQKLG